MREFPKKENNNLIKIHNKNLELALKEQEEQTAKEIFERFDYEISVLKRRYKKIPLNLEVFFKDYEEFKKKHLGDVTFLKKKAHNSTFIESEEPKKVKK